VVSKERKKEKGDTEKQRKKEREKNRKGDRERKVRCTEKRQIDGKRDTEKERRVKEGGTFREVEKETKRMEEKMEII
jgi:hypothetical protein